MAKRKRNKDQPIPIPSRVIWQPLSSNTAAHMRKRSAAEAERTKSSKLARKPRKKK